MSEIKICKLFKFYCFDLTFTTMRILSLLSKLVVAGIGIWGIYENMVMNRHWCALFSYFTILSNVVVTLYSLITAIIMLFGSKLQHKLYYKLKGSFMLCILVTHLVYAILLAPQFNKNPRMAAFVTSYANYLTHYVIPWLFTLDYLIFDEKGHFKWYDAFIWAFVALLYIPFAYTRVYIVGYFDKDVGNKYPYFFMDIDKFGVKGVAMFISGLVGVFMVFAWIIIFIDYQIAKFINKKSKKSHKD